MKLTMTALCLAALAIPGAAFAHGDDRGRGGDRGDRFDDRSDQRDFERGRDERGDPRRPDVVVVGRGHDDNGFRADDIESQIRWGVAQGLLTDREANRLRNQNRDLEALKRRVYRDGRLSRGEANQLARLEERVRGELAHELRDGDRRGMRRNTRTVVYVPPAPARGC